MKYLLLALLTVLLVGCQTAKELDNINITENITQDIQGIVESLPNVTEDVQQAVNTTLNTLNESIGNVVDTTEDVVEALPKIVPLTPYAYSGNPLDKFNEDTTIIFGEGGPLVAATINLQAYLGELDYKLDDKGELPTQNVILLGNCTNSYIAKITDCSAKTQLYKKDHYILVIEADSPTTVFNEVEKLIS